MNRSTTQLCILAFILFAFSHVVRAQVTIPDDVTVRLMPAGLDLIDDEKKVYQLKDDMWVTIYVENRSKQRLKWNVVDPYFAYRIQLFKGDVLIPYREEITSIIRSQDENVKPVQIERDRFIEPEATQALQNMQLYDWYGPLAPGIYRVIIRRRFELGGPWTRDSAPMFFEVPEIKIKAPITPAPDAPKLIRKPRP